MAAARKRLSDRTLVAARFVQRTRPCSPMAETGDDKTVSPPSGFVTRICNLTSSRTPPGLSSDGTPHLDDLDFWMGDRSRPQAEGSRNGGKTAENYFTWPTET